MGIAFERIVIVMLENSTRANVLANPYMSALRSKGVFLANSLGVTHVAAELHPVDRRRYLRDRVR